MGYVDHPVALVHCIIIVVIPAAIVCSWAAIITRCLLLTRVRIVSTAAIPVDSWGALTLGQGADGTTDLTLHFLGTRAMIVRLLLATSMALDLLLWT